MPSERIYRDVIQAKSPSKRLRVWRTAATCVAIAGVSFMAGFSFRGLAERPAAQTEDLPPDSMTTSPRGKKNTHGPGGKAPQQGAVCSAPWRNPCFDRRRCVGVDGSPKLSIYAHDFNCTDALSGEIMTRENPIGSYRTAPIGALKSFRELALKRGFLAERVEDACIIVYAVTSRNRCITHTSEWNGGRNHLLVDWDDRPREFYVDLHHSAAMWAQANMQARYFRFGYDIAVPFPPKVRLQYLADIPLKKRKFLATFKGQLYLSGSGSEERNALLRLGITANSSDVIVLEECQEKHKEHLLPENLELCKNLKEGYGRHSYEGLMNTRFAMIPAGRSPATFRLGEAMSAGAIPVFFHNGFVKPFPDRIPWQLCSFSFSVEEAPVVIDTLRAVPERKLHSMKRIVQQVYDKHFKGGIGSIVRATLDTLENRLAFHSERMR